MTYLAKLFEHNNWANRLLIEACTALADEPLDAVPMSTSDWSIRHTLLHLVESQAAYLALLTQPLDVRKYITLSCDELADVAGRSGEGLLALARDESDHDSAEGVLTLDGHEVKRWVVMLQAINHATDHRRQIGTMMRTLGLTRLNLDGWTFGDAEGACVPTSA